MRFTILALMLAGPAVAADCPNPAGWAKPEQHRAARSPDLKFALKPDASYELALLPQDQVKFAVGEVRRKGLAGVAAIDVPKAGTLTVMAGNRTFVDLVRDGKALDLSGEPAHPDCPGVRKALTFKVSPGRYVLQLSGSEDATVRLATTLR